MSDGLGTSIDMQTDVWKCVCIHLRIIVGVEMKLAYVHPFPQLITFIKQN